MINTGHLPILSPKIGKIAHAIADPRNARAPIKPMYFPVVQYNPSYSTQLFNDNGDFLIV